MQPDISGETFVRMKKFDILTMLALSLAALFSRIPFRSEYLYHWDSVNFALGLKQYNILAHQPHPPGYFLYSMLGKSVNYFIQNENASLVWISLISGVFGIAAIYWLGHLIFDRRVGLLAALLTLVSPLHWFYSEVALSYQLEFFFVILIAGFAYILLSGKHKIWPWLAFVLGVAGGFRLNALIFLTPLWLICLVQLEWRKRILSVAILTAVSLAWVIPMLITTGGIQSYFTVMGDQGGYVLNNSSIFSITQIATNIVRTAVFIAYGVTIGGFIIIWGLWLFLKHWGGLIHDRSIQSIGLWLLPSLGFYTLLFVRQHGYIFTFLPALILIIAMLLVKLGDRVRHHFHIQMTPLLAAPVLLVNLLFFLLAPPQLFGLPNLIFQTPSWNTIRETDQITEEWSTIIQSRFTPEETIVFAYGRFYRHPDYYLSNFQLPALYNNLRGENIDLNNSVKTVVLLDNVYAENILSKYNFEKISLESGLELKYITLSGPGHFRISRTNFDIVQP
jgi:uncharacterized membrane protein